MHRMKYLCQQWRSVCAAAALAVVGGLTAAPARAQGATDPRPQWMKDVQDRGGFVNNDYLALWVYGAGSNVTKWDLWTQSGDPLQLLDDFTIFFDPTDATKYGVPWGSRLFSAPHPPYGASNADTDPYANNVTIRVDDPASMTGFTDLDFPEDGNQVFSPPVATLPAFQGIFSPWRFTDQGQPGTLEINQRLQFTRDLLRIEYAVKNQSGTPRRVGIRTVVDPYIDYWGPTRSFFIPQTQDRLFIETDYGSATGTTTLPRDPRVPDEWHLYDNDESPNPIWHVKGILRGNGATPPTRVVFGNSLNSGWYAPAQAWDYSVDNPMELRISDMATMIYWDPIEIPAGQQRYFVTYAGMGVASHAMSNAYLAWQARTDLTDVQRNFTQGYVGAVQSPEALPLRGGDADAAESTIVAYMQNEYHDTNLPNAFAFIDLPDALEFGASNTSQSQRLDLGTLTAVGSGQLDEAQGSWTVQPTGIEAGYLPVDVTFSNGFQDATRVTRFINIPQGRKYQFGDDFRMITFPFNYQGLQNDPSQVLGLPSDAFQALKWNPEISTYEQVSQFEPGQSYWIRMLGQGSTTVRLNNATPINLTQQDSFTSQVRRGWNQVGNPSPYAVPVRNLRFLLPGGQIIPYDEAVRQKLVGPAMWEYNRKTGRYEQLTQDSLIQPGRGVWIFAYSERNIVWPAPTGPQISITP
jgi:hypothetical protein